VRIGYHTRPRIGDGKNTKARTEPSVANRGAAMLPLTEKPPASARGVRHFFRAYGLNLSADAPVPGLREDPSHSGRPDVVMNFGAEPPWVREAMRLSPRVDCLRAQAEGEDSLFKLTSLGEGAFFQLAYGDGTRFIVDGAATRLWETWRPTLTPEDAATYLLGPVMGFVLRRRGVMALHASSVAVSDRAVVLCGPSESGKSTTAAALALRGIPVLAEDVAPIKEDKGSLYVEPGYPRVCLWPDVVETLFGVPGAMPQITPTWEKCFLPLDGGRAKFESKKRPLGVIYVFAPRVDEVDAPRIEDLGMREALLGLVQNTYMNWLLSRKQRAEELDALTKLVARVPVRRIVPHADPQHLGALCELIMKDAEHSWGRQTLAGVSSGS